MLLSEGQAVSVMQPAARSSSVDPWPFFCVHWLLPSPHTGQLSHFTLYGDVLEEEEATAAAASLRKWLEDRRFVAVSVLLFLFWGDVWLSLGLYLQGDDRLFVI